MTDRVFDEKVLDLAQKCLKIATALSDFSERKLEIRDQDN